MTRSEQIDELAAALAKAQAAITGAKKDSENPHFRSAYADLSSVWQACRGPLTSNGLSVVQSPRLVHAGDEHWLVEVETLLLHSSGQWLSDVLAVPVTTPTAQGVGSAITYAKRYALSAFVGVAPEGEDDDGNVASSARPDRTRDDGESASTPSAPRAKPRKAPAAGGATDRAVGRVASVSRRVLPSGKEKLIVKLANDGREFETWSTTTATAARDAKDAARDVELVFKPGKFGLDILAIRDPHEPEPPL